MKNTSHILMEKRSTLKNDTIVSSFGIGIEYYIVFTLGFLGKIIFPQFIPFEIRDGVYWELFSSLLIMAPILGALFYGHKADRIGRKKILAWMVALVSIPAFAISILPTHSEWGIYSSVLFGLLVLVQAFAFGGDMVGLLTFVLEEIPEKEGSRRSQKGLYGGFMSFGAGIGVGLSALSIGLVYPQPLVPLQSIAWRYLLCPGGLGILVVAYLHVKTHETEKFDYYKEHFYTSFKEAIPIKELFSKSGLSFVQVVFMSVLVPIITVIIFAYFPYHIGIKELKLMPRDVMLNLAFSLAIFSVFAPVFGRVSDRIGRKKMLKRVSASLFVLSLLILVFLRYLSPQGYFMLQFLLIFVSSGYFGVTFAACVETFMTHVRFTGISLSYAINSVVFGQHIGAYITNTLEKIANFSIFTPFAYLLLGSALVFMVMSLKKETAFTKLSDN